MAADDIAPPVKIEEEKTAKPALVSDNNLAQQPITFQATLALLHVR